MAASASAAASVTAAASSATAGQEGQDLLTGHAGREQMRVDADTVLVLIDTEGLSRRPGDEPRQAAVLANVQKLHSAWAKRRMPVLAVDHGVVRLLDGGLQPPLPSPGSSALLVDPDASAFISTNLDYVLRRLGGRRFVVAGNGAERTIESTVRDGADKGYIITYATDVVLGGSLQAEARAAYNLKGFARIRTIEEILAELDAPVPVPAPAALAPGGKTALLVIDVQYYCADVGAGGMHDAAHAHEQGDGGIPSFSFARRIRETMVPSIGRLLRRCRALGYEVIFTTIEDLTHDGRDRSLDYKLSSIDVPKGHRHAQVLDEIAPLGDEIQLPKTSASVFTSTAVDYLLQNLGVTSLVLCGMISNQCVESSARDAAGLGYAVTMVADATTAHGPDDQAAAEETLRRLGRVMTTDEILMAPDSPLAPPPHARIVRLAVLRAEGNTTYGDCILPSFQQLFRAAAASLAEDEGVGGGGNGSGAAAPAVVVELHDFDVKKGHFPPQETWGDYDGFLLPGSYSSAYDDEAWIHELKRTIRELHARETRMVGVCFGHQIIGQALGGQVTPNPKGLTVGRRKFEATAPNGAAAPAASPSSLYYYHADIVAEAPPGAVVVGVDERCPNHGMRIGGHILTVQGHPEFAPCAPAGHRALKAILVEKGMQGMEWGERKATDSLLWARRFLRHFLAAAP